MTWSSCNRELIIVGTLKERSHLIKTVCIRSIVNVLLSSFVLFGALLKHLENIDFILQCNPELEKTLKLLDVVRCFWLITRFTEAAASACVLAAYMGLCARDTRRHVERSNQSFGRLKAILMGNGFCSVIQYVA